MYERVGAAMAQARVALLADSMATAPVASGGAAVVLVAGGMTVARVRVAIVVAMMGVRASEATEAA